MSVQEGHEPRRGIVVVGRRSPLRLRPHHRYRLDVSASEISRRLAPGEAGAPGPSGLALPR